MRVFSRFALVVTVVALSVSPLLADHLTADCPLTLVANNQPVSDFGQSPHGVFRSGNLVFVLRGQTLTTYNVTDLGDLSIAREDFIASLGARDVLGGVAFNNGFLFISSESGLEIYDLRNVRAGGNAPLLVSRTPGIHYRRLAVSGNVLAGIFPGTDLACFPRGTTVCANQIDLFNITNLSAPVRSSTITSLNSLFLGFSDIVFNNGFLFATGPGGTGSFNVSNPASPLGFSFTVTAPGTFLLTNGSNLLGVGTDTSITLFNVIGGSATPFSILFLPEFLRIDLSNPIRFHRNAWFDDPNGRVITMIEEVNPLTFGPARTVAFDVFDFTVPFFEGSAPRAYESISPITTPSEVKFNPVAVGPYVFVVGELSGLQTWGACNQLAGRIELAGATSLPCGGAEIHGWVTGPQRITNVELFLDATSLGSATVGGPPRIDISTRVAVVPWRLNVNFDNQARGERTLRAVGTDTLGNRRQFASMRVFFPGPGQNCLARRRSVNR
jgi:hypothetical protein